MTRVLLINPPNSVPLQSDFVVNLFQPLGLAYVAAVLRRHHITVRILDALALGFDSQTIIGNRRVIGLDYRQISAYIKKFKPDIVGISIPFSFQALEAHHTAKITKAVNPKIIVVAGGSHATIVPEELLSDKNFDFVIRGEGEYSFLEFVKSFKSPKYKKIPGLSYRRAGKIVDNPRTLPILRLDDLPLPARDLLPMNRYFDAAKKGRVVEGLLEFGQKRTSLFTSRGCPFNCTFCSVHLTMTRTWRARTPENVLGEIEQCVRDYGIRYFDILDDNFTLDPARAKKICRLIIDRGLKIKWSTPNGIRADTVDEELIILMKQAGCIQIKVAPESGSLRTLNQIIKKHLDLNKVREVVKLCRKHRLSVEAFFVIGFPEETEADILETVSFGRELRRLGCDYCYFFIATPYRGTEMFSRAVAKGYLNLQHYNLNETITTSGHSLLQSPNFTASRLLELQKQANRINPPVTSVRLISGFKVALHDPLRILRFAVNYAGYFLSG